MEVILIAATSIDGFIAQNKNQISTSWTSQADRQWFAQITRTIGVIIMGKNTYATIGKPLPGRHNIIYTKRPDLETRDLLRENLEFTNLEPKDLILDLQKRGYNQVAICGGAAIYNLFMQTKLITKLYLTIEPIIFGQGLKLFDNINLVDIKLQLVDTQKLGGEGAILLQYNLIQ